MELKHYETIFIITPVLSDQQIKDTVDEFRNVLIHAKGEIVHEENWGLKKLAYPIQHKSSGYYQLFEFKALPTVISLLETTYKRNEKILRFLTIALDKKGVRYNDRKRKGEFNKKNNKD